MALHRCRSDRNSAHSLFQVVAIDKLGYLAFFAVANGCMLASKRISTEPLVALHRCFASGTLAAVSEGGVALWRIERDVQYNVFRGGHTGPVVSLYACSGGLVRS